ncbi:MAG: flavodoxin family protein [Holophagaceae bacterium]|nr:flavodoxin family protein [Holophagaceae bacterium]
MQVTVITGSPHKKGTTSLLADEFIRGAVEAGHIVFRFDAAFEKVSPCLGCDGCRTSGTQCVQHDSMEKLNPSLLASDCIVFVTPLYYFGMSAQLKTVIDRFYANNSKLQSSKQAILLTAAADSETWTVEALDSHYGTILRYLGWQLAGTLLAMGCAVRMDIEKTDYPNQAYLIGKTLGQKKTK